MRGARSRTGSSRRASGKRTSRPTWATGPERSPTSTAGMSSYSRSSSATGPRSSPSSPVGFLVGPGRGYPQIFQ